MKTIVLIDGQNLYHLARELWAPRPQVGGSPYGYPSYDVEKLADALVKLDAQRILSEIRFYTGVPDPKENYFWHGFWNNKLRYLTSRGIHVYRGRINPGGQEKGVDVSLAIDLIRLTYEHAYDVAIIISQDWDFGPAIALAKRIAKDQKRYLQFFSAFPYDSNLSRTRRGIPGTTWIHIEKTLYDSCLDANDYRPMPKGGKQSSS